MSEPTAPEYVVEDYTCGLCMFMALALHERYGWPLFVMLIDYGPGSEKGLAHAFVCSDEGTVVDVLGVKPIEAVMRVWDYDELRRVNRGWLVQWLRNRSWSSAARDSKMEQARIDMEHYVVPLIEWHYAGRVPEQETRCASTPQPIALS